MSVHRAFIVEDDPASREALRRLLHALGYEAEAVGTLAEAGRYLDSAGYLFLDLHLPDGNGNQLLRQIRERGLAIRVAVTTGLLPRITRNDRSNKSSSFPDLQLFSLPGRRGHVGCASVSPCLRASVVRISARRFKRDCGAPGPSRPRPYRPAGV